MRNIDTLMKLVKENPDLPVVPMVDSEVVADDGCAWWMGSFGQCEVTEYYHGREKIHFKDDDEEDVLADLCGCKYWCAPDGRSLDDLTDDEWKKLYGSVEWVRAIVVYIDTP